ncbi:TadE/TadG family type IV pilus assembly protein [Devosia sediminis]|uniref:Pilus assembly protein n=1 Tax=Devosia sediminis TaxID=2798801 RepID=A0A934MIR1_9HYPH|nr:TadE/TadG family type IV pilus assembly protein [Devosia sediminis]MBJ3786482.1 pilus assembly protein [Devosia sediminis]
MKVTLRRFLRATDGTSAIEFALLVLPFLLMVVGTIEVSRAWWTRQAIQDVASATARCIGVGQLQCTLDGAYSPERALDFATGLALGRGVALTEGETTLERNVTCQDMTGAVRVTVQSRFQSVLPMEWLYDFRADACFVDWSAV